MENNPNVFFPVLLRDALIANKITPFYLSRETRVSIKTILGWLRAATMPMPFNAWMISEILPNNQAALLASYLRWYQARRTNVDPYRGFLSIRDGLDAVMRRRDWFPPNYQKLDNFAEAWIKAVEYAESYGKKKSKELDATHDLIILPELSIEIIEQWESIAEHISRDSNQLYKLSWKAFEDLIAHLLETYGWSTTSMGYTKDGGIDIIAVKSVIPDIPIRMMVQCKKLSKGQKVGVEVVREIWSIKWQQAFQQAMIATTSYFTKGAKADAETWSLELRDHDAILQWCKRVGKIV